MLERINNIFLLCASIKNHVLLHQALHAICYVNNMYISSYIIDDFDLLETAGELLSSLELEMV